MKTNKLWLAAALAAQFSLPNLVAAPASGVEFTQITEGEIVTQLRKSLGAAWTDFNNDGYIDLYICHNGGLNSRFLNNGPGGGFTRSSGPGTEEETLYPLNAAWADYDNDGFVDLFQSNYNAPSFLFLNDRAGSFQRQANRGFTELPANTIGAAWADFNNDGHLDLAMANGGLSGPQVDFLFRADGNGSFERVLPTPVSETLASMLPAWSDIDNDGDQDLLVVHRGNRNSLFRNNGDGTFVKIQTGRIATDIFSAFAPAFGDYDNDGDLDLFITCWFDGLQPNVFYRNLGNGTFERLFDTGLTSIQSGFLLASWGDYDNDGFLDLFVSESLEGQNLLYRNRGDGTFEQITAGPGASRAHSAGCAWGDYDNDGFLDLFVANGENNYDEADFLFHNEGNANRWLKLRCVGTVSNRSAIGARVRAQVTINGASRWLTREISAGAISHDFPFVHFGLGDATVVETLEIRWPSGTVQALRDVAPNQHLHIVEPARASIAPRAGGQVEVAVQGGRRRAHRLEATTDFAAWEPLARLSTENFNGRASHTETAAGGAARHFRAVATEVENLVALPPTSLPEGIAVDFAGNVYVSAFTSGEIRKITPNGAVSPFSQVPAGAAGMCIDGSQNIYVAANALGENETGRGVWRIGLDGTAALFASMPAGSFANDVIATDRGELFISDSIGGKVFKATGAGAAAEWARSSFLEGTPNPQPPHPPFPIGANGIALTRGNVFVGNTDLGTIVRIPVNPDGSAGEAVLFARDARLFGTDGIIADAVGNLYVANIIQNTILKVSPTGAVETLADARDGLDGPSSLRFGTSIVERAVLYIVNYAFVTAETGGEPHPGVMKLPVPIAGPLLPGY